MGNKEPYSAAFAKASNRLRTNKIVGCGAGGGFKKQGARIDRQAHRDQMFTDYDLKEH
jgi:hypothetical protein